MNDKEISGRAEMLKMSSMEILAIEKAGNIEGWFPYYFEALDSGILVKGCLTETFKRGKRKGERKFLIKQSPKTIALSVSDLLKTKSTINDNGDESKTCYEAHLQEDLYVSRKKVGELYKIISGKADHYCDCSTNNAPAELPEECDC